MKKAKELLLNNNGHDNGRVGAQVFGRPPGLSIEDQGYLDTYECRLQLVRDRVGAVAAGYSTGFYLHGEGGLGKSFVVLRELERQG